MILAFSRTNGLFLYAFALCWDRILISKGKNFVNVVSYVLRQFQNRVKVIFADPFTSRPVFLGEVANVPR